MLGASRSRFDEAAARDVLILVFREDMLGEDAVISIITDNNRLNPCFSGRYAGRS